MDVIEHGEEKQMTLKWIGPGRKEKRYCCDFIFLTEKLLKGATADIHDLWSGEYAKLSDHKEVIRHSWLQSQGTSARLRY